jgi:hypothetical protein
VRFLGLTSPQELEEYGMFSAADLVDLVSRVRDLFFSFILTMRCKLVFNIKVYDQHIYYIYTFFDAYWCMCLSSCGVDQPLL